MNIKIGLKMSKVWLYTQECNDRSPHDTNNNHKDGYDYKYCVVCLFAMLFRCVVLICI